MFSTSRKNSGEEYEYVLKVWSTFQMKTMKDYHNLYLKCDVLFLIDVFKNLKITA